MNGAPKSDFLHIMVTRGYYQDCTDLEALDQALTKGPITGYIGFDATAKSLHIGSLIQIMMLRWFQKTGHRPITLMGGGTTRIGDPTDRADERPLLSSEDIDTNIRGIKQVFSKYLDYNDTPNGGLMLDNAEWLDTLGYLDFLRDVGRHFSVNRMLAFDSVKTRLERAQSLSFLEFNYMILQAYDFMELNKRHDCLLQMGGSDQWGNIVNGIDLARRKENTRLYGLTSPLLTTSDGRKMGKSQSGALWLNADMLDPFDFWQYWRNTTDADTGRFLKLYTELPLDECVRLGALGGSEINAAKIILATEITKLCHGEEAAHKAQATAQDIFEQAGSGGAHLPVVEIPIPESPVLITALFAQAGLCPSGSAAKRLILEGGAKSDDQILDDPLMKIAPEHLGAGIKLSAGKKRHVIVRAKT